MNEKNSHFDHSQYLTFRLGDEEYAVGILQAKEIIAYGILTKVPHTPPSVRGVINLRGTVVPVIDLAVKFGLAAGLVTDRTCIVIVEVDIGGNHAIMGIIADSVSQVVALPDDKILPPPAFGTTVAIDYLRGMAKADDKFVLVLDIDKVLTAEDSAAASSDAPSSTETAAATAAQSDTTAA